MESRDIIVPHDAKRGPLTAVRRMLIHSSLAELQTLGVYDDYCSLMDPETLTGIKGMIGPGWIPADLAIKHYDACEQLGLSDEQVQNLGARSGENIGSALMVAGAQLPELKTEQSTWSMITAFSRMGPRMYEGSSAQYVKLSPHELQIEYVGNPLFSTSYYRNGFLGFLRKSFGQLGFELLKLGNSQYRKRGAEIDMRLSWK
jgi:hypothetical protein